MNFVHSLRPMPASDNWTISVCLRILITFTRYLICLKFVFQRSETNRFGGATLLSVGVSASPLTSFLLRHVAGAEITYN
jgi:hypothetical protein